MNNVADYLKIAVIAFAGVFIINKLLGQVGLEQFKAQ